MAPGGERDPTGREGQPFWVGDTAREGVEGSMEDSQSVDMIHCAWVTWNEADREPENRVIAHACKLLRPLTFIHGCRRGVEFFLLFPRWLPTQLGGEGGDEGGGERGGEKGCEGGGERGGEGGGSISGKRNSRPRLGRPLQRRGTVELRFYRTSIQSNQ